MDIAQPSTSTAKPNIHVKKVPLGVGRLAGYERQDVYHTLLKPGETTKLTRCRQHAINVSDESKRKGPYFGKGVRQVILLHDNARSHVAKGTKEGHF